MLKTFDQIEQLAREKAQDPLLMACIEPHEPALIQAIDRAIKNRLIKPVMIGNEDAILNAGKEVGINTRGWELVRSDEPNSSVYQALELVRDSKVGALCKGVFGIKDFLSLCFELRLGFRVRNNIVSGNLVVENERIGRLLIVADTIVCPHPEMMDLIAILNDAVLLSHNLANDDPKVALLAAAEVIYPQMPVTLAAAVISKMVDKGQITGCKVDGPLSLDVALMPEAAEGKKVGGPVAGRADIVIGHNLAVNYGVYRAFSLYTASKLGVVLTGGKVPAVVTSSYDTTETKYNSLVLSVVAAKG
jgi:phosphate butyryltransferase